MSYRYTIVRNSESLPSDCSGSRLWRSGVFAKYFSNNGYEVSWITSSFDHYNQKNRKEVTPFPDGSNLHNTISLISTCGYKKNISLLRFYDHFVFGIKLFIHLIKAQKPDIIICSYPTPDSSFFCVLYGVICKVPVVIDIRDKWPDVLVETNSSNGNVLVKLATLPYELIKKITMRYATSLLAANPEFLKWGLKNGNRKLCNLDNISYIPFEEPLLEKQDYFEAGELVALLPRQGDSLLVTFAGTLGQMFEFEALFDALHMANESKVNIEVIICGRGSELDSLKIKFRDFPNVLFPGQLNAKVVFALLKKSDILFAPYRKMSNFYDHLPNKFMEYSAAGRPIVSSLQGIAETLIKKNRLGNTFESGKSLFQIFSKYCIKKELILTESSNARSLYNKMFHPNILLPELELKMNSIIRDYKKRKAE